MRKKGDKSSKASPAKNISNNLFGSGVLYSEKVWIFLFSENLLQLFIKKGSLTETDCKLSGSKKISATPASKAMALLLSLRLLVVSKRQNGILGNFFFSSVFCNEVQLTESTSFWEMIQSKLVFLDCQCLNNSKPFLKECFSSCSPKRVVNWWSISLSQLINAIL